MINALSRCQESQLAGGGGVVLEVGCGEAKRLAWINENMNLMCRGIDPSKKAVLGANKRGVDVLQGTADELPYADQSIDFVVFGFCLYLCDRSDLFRIAHEANRVLKPDAWVIIHDFIANTPTMREYHHLTGLYSYKMDYRKMFDWHPDYTCFSHEINPHEEPGFTDDSDEWVATSIMRKKSH